MYPAFMLARNAALRDSEIKTLTWGRVNLKAKTLQVGKSKSDAGEGRIIPLNSDLFEALAEHVPGVRRVRGGSIGVVSLSVGQAYAPGSNPACDVAQNCMENYASKSGGHRTLA